MGVSGASSATPADIVTFGLYALLTTRAVHVVVAAINILDTGLLVGADTACIAGSTGTVAIIPALTAHLVDTEFLVLLAVPVIFAGRILRPTCR